MKTGSRFTVKTLSVVILFAIAAMFSSCANFGMKTMTANTNLQLSANGSGSRQIICPINHTLVESKVAGGKGALDALIEENCPEGLNFDKSNNSEYVFTLDFSSVSEYKQKASAISGLACEVNMGVPNSIFAKGFKFSENFTSGDLLGWISKTAIEKQLFDESVVLWNYNQNNIIFEGEAYTASENLTVSDVEYESVEKITMATDSVGDGTFSRTISYYIPKNTVDKMGESLAGYMQSLRPEGSTSSESDTETGKVFTTTFSAADMNSLSSQTNICMGNQTGYITDLEKEGSVFPSERFMESIDLSNFPADESLAAKIEYSFKFDQNANQNMVYTYENGTKQDMTQNIADGKIDISSSLSNFIVEIDSSNQYKLVDYSISIEQKSDNKFDEVIMLNFAEDSSDVASNLVKEYVERYSLAGTSAEVSGSLCTINVSGDVQTINAANTTLFSAGNNLTVEKDGKFELYDQILVKGHISFSDFFAKIGNGDNIKVRFVSHYPISKIETSHTVEQISDSEFVINMNASETVELSLETKRIDILFLVIIIIAGLLFLVIVALLIGYFISRYRDAKSVEDYEKEIEESIIEENKSEQSEEEQKQIEEAVSEDTTDEDKTATEEPAEEKNEQEAEVEAKKENIFRKIFGVFLNKAKDDGDDIEKQDDTEQLKPTGELCANCQSPLYEGMKYCLKCGHGENDEEPKSEDESKSESEENITQKSQAEEESAKEEELKPTGLFCKECNAEIYEGMTFCVKCGAQVSEEKEESEQALDELQEQNQEIKAEDDAVNEDREISEEDSNEQEKEEV
ncbi:MAG: hypothetical protein Q4B14_03660 [Clostridia bacterium]|nr:hypothetical protein [Clostridia bacterium]